MTNDDGIQGSDAAILRDAYERGRRRLGIQRASWAIPFGLFAFAALAVPWTAAVALTIVLAGAFGLTQHLGLSLGRGGRAGMLFGLVPLVSPWIVQRTHLCCMGGACDTNCMQVCALGSFTAGLAFAVWARRDPSPLRFAAAGGAVMLAASTLGCAVLEWGGLIGVAAGLIATLPVLAFGSPATSRS